MNNIVIAIPVIPAIAIDLLIVAVIGKAVRYYKNIKIGTYFFARKIDLSISEKLLKKLNLWVR